MGHTDPPGEYDYPFFKKIPSYVLDIQHVNENLYTYTVQLYNMYNRSHDLTFKYFLDDTNIDDRIETIFFQGNGKQITNVSFSRVLDTVNYCQPIQFMKCSQLFYKRLESFDIILKLTMERDVFYNNSLVKYEHDTQTLVIPFTAIVSLCTSYTEKDIVGCFRPPLHVYKKPIRNVLVTGIKHPYKTLSIKVDPKSSAVIAGTYDFHDQRDYGTAREFTGIVCNSNADISFPDDALSIVNDNYFSIHLGRFTCDSLLESREQFV